jgi:hypothetical protein
MLRYCAQQVARHIGSRKKATDFGEMTKTQGANPDDKTATEAQRQLEEIVRARWEELEKQQAKEVTLGLSQCSSNCYDFRRFAQSIYKERFHANRRHEHFGAGNLLFEPRCRACAHRLESTGEGTTGRSQGSIRQIWGRVPRIYRIPNRRDNLLQNHQVIRRTGRVSAPLE